MPSAAVGVDYDPFAGGELQQVVPTTEPQREVWLAAKLAMDASLAYNESVSLRLRGRLDVAGLERALLDLVSLHDALRSTLSPDGETLCVLESAGVPLRRTNLADLADEDRTAAVQARLRASVETPFVLEQGPLLRAELLHLSAEEHLLVLSAHHIICDGWSWWVIVRQLGSLYASACGHAVEALPVPGSYTNFALTEIERAGSAAEREDEKYWLSRFPDEAPALDLPTDRPRPGRRGFASSREDYVLDADLVLGLRKLGARSGASLFATLLAGFGTVLSRISGQQDVVIGIPAAGQSVAGRADLVGHCVNLLPLRFDMQPDLAFSSVLGQSKEILLDAIEHQRYTFGTLLRKIRVERDPSRLPLVSVMFNIDQALDQEREVFPGLSLEFTTNPRSFENFELSINAVQCIGELRLECQYNSVLFEAATVRRWLSAYESLLRSVVHHAESPISRLALVDVAARMDLEALQPAPEPYDRELLMHQGFERACDADPAREAVVFGDQSWSYAQLELRSNQIAHLLRSHGARRGTLVGLAVDRGPDMLASLLGILKTGAGYVPLDPQFPVDRIAYMAADAGLAVLITQVSHTPAFSLGKVPVIALDAAGTKVDSQPGTRLPRDKECAGPETTAYVIYTSGSTGKPKGVKVPHRAVANFLVAMKAEPGIVREDILVAVTTLSFDIAVLELMLPLSVGARVVIGAREEVMDGAAFMRLLSNCGATMLQATPAMWRLLLDAGWRGASGFRALCGGEPLPQDLAAALLSRCGQLWNLYGPTETTVWSTCARILPVDPVASPDIHIGRPILNTRILILDEQGELCPRGVPGEICIGGEGVTSGYLHRPELTSEKFIADRYRDPALSRPLDASPALLYRTGDRGRWRNDGNLEHLGRLDFQVKVRGYRIELGEIENRLVEHESVLSAVAMAREDRPGDVRLVAYVVGRRGNHGDTGEVLSQLRRTLPEYMVPQHLVWLQAIPLLPNGKIDRKQLPAPSEVAPPRRIANAVVVEEPLVATILEAMGQMLSQPAMAVDDNFFELGGHSLLAAQFCAKLGKQLGIEVPLRQIFDTPTPSSLAAALGPGLVGGRQAGSTALAIPRRRDRAVAPMTLMQEGMWVAEQFSPGGIGFNTPSAHRLHGPINLEAFDQAFCEMVRRQPVLRTCLVPEGDTAVQVVQDSLEFSLLPLVDLTSVPAVDRHGHLMQALEELIALPFDLAHAPLFRARMYRVGAEDHVLFFMTHHIIWDGWSFDVFYAEMSALYLAFSSATPNPLPPLAFDYGDFAQWQRDNTQGLKLDRQLAHWKQHLSGTIEPLRLPQDRQRPAVATGRSGTEWIHLDAGLVGALREAGSRVGSTLFMTLLTGYYILLHRLAGQKDLVVGLPFRNRPTEESERLMGFFVNMLPLRLTLDPSKSFLELVKQVRDSVVEAFSFPDVPFDRLMSELRVTRDASRSPVFQAVFSFQDVRERKLQWGGLRHEHLLLFQQGMPHDIGLWLLEHDAGLSGPLGYNSDIIDSVSAAAFGARYKTLLASLCTHPERPVAEARLLAKEDVTRLLAWNATGCEVPSPGTADALISRQSRLRGDCVAIRAGVTTTTFAALELRSERIAAALFARGLRRGDLVGVCLSRHADMVATMLAAWKIGAAYVPLDPAYPVQRIRFMCEDANLALLVSEGELSQPLQLPAPRVLLLDRDHGEIESAARFAPLGQQPNDAELAAYVIYTSGSTGRPKGVCVPHGAVINFLASMAKAPGMQAGEKLLAVTTTSFDIAVLEIFLPLSVGGEVILVDREEALDGVALKAVIQKHDVDLMQATPSTWLMLLESGWQGAPQLRALCGGEALPASLAQRLLMRCGALWNMYGPTETTVWSTCARIDRPAAGGEMDIHIGTPIDNTSVWILDDAGTVCPPGVAGEICIGGSGVTLGYLDRPELTKERFVQVGVPSSDSGEASCVATLYRTGDLGRWRPDGVLEHMGRLDFQVKVRGHRIELGEIEARLECDGSVARAVVVAREDRPEDVRLVGYVVAAEGATIGTRALAAALRTELPSYMLPQHLVVLETLPLLPNGKVDRNLLPPPQAKATLLVAEPALEQAPVAKPAPVVETAAAGRHHDRRVIYLMELWSGILGTPASPQDNFFDLGGHSMLAVQMANRVARDTGVRLHLLVLATQTLAQVATGLPEMSPAGEQVAAGRRPDWWRRLKRAFGNAVPVSSNDGR